MSSAVQPGLYRHFKGSLYRVSHVVTHSETEEPMVVYQALYGAKGWWVRPLSMFDEWVEKDGQRQRRFARCEVQTMCLESVCLTVPAGQAREFENAFAQAQLYLQRAEGYLEHQLRRADTQAGRYLLQVVWETRQHHEQGFRGSPDYQQWSALLHKFYPSLPTVEYFNSPLNL